MQYIISESMYLLTNTYIDENLNVGTIMCSYKNLLKRIFYIGINLDLEPDIIQKIPIHLQKMCQRWFFSSKMALITQEALFYIMSYYHKNTFSCWYESCNLIRSFCRSYCTWFQFNLTRSLDKILFFVLLKHETPQDIITFRQFN